MTIRGHEKFIGLRQLPPISLGKRVGDVCRPVDMPGNLSVSLSGRLSVCPFVRPSVRLSVCLCLSVGLSTLERMNERTDGRANEPTDGRCEVGSSHH